MHGWSLQGTWLGRAWGARGPIPTLTQNNRCLIEGSSVTKKSCSLEPLSWSGCKVAQPLSSLLSFLSVCVISSLVGKPSMERLRHPENAFKGERYGAGTALHVRGGWRCPGCFAGGQSHGACWIPRDRCGRRRKRREESLISRLG